MFRRHFFLVAALCVIGLMVVAGGLKLAFFQDRGGNGGGGRNRGAQAVAVVPASVTPRPFTNDIQVLGAAKARQSVTLTAPATQLVTKINFQSGQFVRQGQVLAELNAQEQDANIIQAKAALDFAQKTRDRWQALADRGVAPKATAEQYQSAYEQAKANLDAMRARAGDRVIRAPFSGVVGLTDAAPGMLINPGATIATLDDLSVIRVDFPVAERYLSALSEGVPIAATTDAYPDRVFNGRIAKLDTRLDPGSRSLVARAEFANPDGRLKPGMLMKVSIKQNQRVTPSVPEAAVAFEAQNAYVLAIQPAPKGLRAVRQNVKIGVRQGGFIEVVDGLEPGQRVVAQGLNRVNPGQAVMIADSSGKGAGQGAGRRRKPA